nr:deSI-like protein At4g17486 [Ipomoea trifida]
MNLFHFFRLFPPQRQQIPIHPPVRHNLPPPRTVHAPPKSSDPGGDLRAALHFSLTVACWNSRTMSHLRQHCHRILAIQSYYSSAIYDVVLLPSPERLGVHGLEYGYGAHDFSSSGVFEVEPRTCPGFIFRRSILLGGTDMSPSEVRSFMEQLSRKYHGDSYHLIAKNCNHFTDEVCMQLTGKPIPGWVNRLARVGSFCNCLLPENIQVTAVRRLPDRQTCSDIETDSGASSLTELSDGEEVDHQLLTARNSDVAFLNQKTVILSKELL